MNERRRSRYDEKIKNAYSSTAIQKRSATMATRVSARKLQLWTVSDGNGFQALRFTDNFKARHKDLFEDDSDE
ncbi:MAG: hypothetical protein E6H44_02190 [Betaproteobacteria bacterium]|jgi:hypothetical protein|nr:MAG: hypothetical protein E6H44_02190 [Betaproteobacteria bacterium]